MDRFVLKVALEYKNVIGSFGGTFKFPKSNDISETYPYRTFNAFINKCRSFSLNNDQILEVIRIVVRYMHKNKLSRRGIGIFSSPDIVDICVDELKHNVIVSNDILKTFIECIKILNYYDDKIEYLVTRVNGGLPNLVILRNKSIFPDHFICLSKSCVSAYNIIDISDRNMLLSPKEYIILKMKIINMIGFENIKNVLGIEFNA